MFLVRIGEITTKSRKTRKNFLRQFLDNVEYALLRESVRDFEIINEWSRIFVKAENIEVLKILQRVFGVVSVSLVEEFHYDDFNDLIQKGKEYFKPLVKEKYFAVRAKRKGKQPFKSTDIEVNLGEALLPFSDGVNLTEPDITCFVEVRDEKVYFFTEKIKGPGGLPLGTEGKALALISGGFDSGVAAYMMMKRGVLVDFLFFNLGGTEHIMGTYRVAEFLHRNWGTFYSPVFYLIDFRPLVFCLRDRCKEQYWNILLKRCMFKLAEKIVQEKKYEGMGTGCSIGQVSSQTLRNLSITDYGSSVSIFRPLLGMDKVEIMKIARDIGTYSISERVKEYCAIVPERPATRPSLNNVLREEEKIPQELLEKAFLMRREYKIPSNELKEIDFPYETEELDNSATLIDLRDKREKQKEPLSDAIEMDFFEIFGNINKLKKNKRYIVLCEYGLKSQEVAQFLQKKGYKAFSLVGGFAKIRKK